MAGAFPRRVVEHVARLDREQLERYFVNAARDGQLMRRMLDTMAEGVIAGTRERVVLFANESIHDLIGVKPDTAVGAPLVNCLRDPALRDAVAQADINAYVSIEVEVHYPRQLDLVAQVIPLAAEEGGGADDPVFLLLLRDVSEERSLSHAKERESRLETLRLLTTGVAHEIGNPLSAIILHTQLMDRTLRAMRSSSHTKELGRINQIVQEESLRLKRIIADFLNAARPLSLRLQRGDIAATAEETLELLYTELNERKIAVIKKIAHVPDTLFDADQIRGVIINVVRNAMDAMANGGTLGLSLASRTGWIEMVVKDDGCGIGADKMDHLFTPFYTTKPHGSGLGLLIVQRVMNAHGGSVRIESREGKGTVVTLELPIRLATGRKFLPSPPRRQTR